ncbi:hypothetical protein A3G67_04545 [Candidatus Roizmanbacteria bacterium RIFCSPLOWO2_12_FULL_40_12]|uniref:PIN domain-containing protein n=1 Tax=Candidatus Roizmanbacteria bacterium RIFCSPLOWO2_01_FULL_40_42 TaxID=1802066 RepID=A0A1F7J4Q7_9BACT|nr:MAG: hypothetical protein A2779_04605 [Candidatus Roizmanbacteria bacterium RIFCSPHIGHO2_01_FULL_40_98]OGK27355.1 MAG: hypothetical protein A3C31_04930 [Candidatus Roizmanbacteria bacterium RIFCSPHIGHO2_02_FULL_40_53]OGK30773.1 MAG: hypothetical protein A2W49_02110 [Candidatus Roizmanbacteria bacterium RIFCSPHIGHO2_12_41_18]OGK36460.1 MAG: hypothetical protein A3E69_02555 [Candidatus Roizmanbacteria bacterium RIFCSPHIGHO2_12_FULL_40_130]OGK50588.1 MAG: hypothetical protein A3B50_02285 [Candi
MSSKLRSQSSQEKPLQQYMLNARHLIQIDSINVVEQHLMSFEQENLLKRMKTGSGKEIFDFLQSKIDSIPPANTTDILRQILGNPTVTDLRALQYRILQEDWVALEKVYLYSLPDRKDHTTFFTNKFLMIVVYRKGIDGRWIAGYSSAIPVKHAHELLGSIHNRLLNKKRDQQDSDSKAQLQETKSASFFLKIPPEEEIYVIDTNVLLQSHDFRNYSFSKKRCSIVIPSVVIQEIDRLKKNPKLKKKCLSISKIIDSLFRNNSDSIPMKLINKGKLRIVLVLLEPLVSSYPPGFTFENPDDRIIMYAKSIALQNKQNKVTVVSADTNMRLKSKIVKLDSLQFKLKINH